jgi:hypothetical protein
MSKVFQAAAFEDSPVTLMNLVKNAMGANITQAALTSITYKVWRHEDIDDATSNLGNRALVVNDGTVIIADCVFDVPLTTAPWNVALDSAGYNFRFTLPGTCLEYPGAHRVEFWFTPVASGAFPVVWAIDTKPLTRS